MSNRTPVEVAEVRDTGRELAVIQRDIARIQRRITLVAETINEQFTRTAPLSVECRMLKPALIALSRISGRLSVSADLIELATALEFFLVDEAPVPHAASGSSRVTQPRTTPSPLGEGRGEGQLHNQPTPNQEQDQCPASA